MRVGFIGTGSMGSILLESLITSHALLPSEIVAHNRTIHKAKKLAEQYPGVKVAESNREVAEECNLLLLCVKPKEYKKVLDEIATYVKPAQLFISITSPVFIEDLEQQLPCKVAKVIPSITNMVHSGSSLVMYGKRCTAEDRATMMRLFSSISHPIEIDERITRVASDITSCGPAFFSFLLQRLIDAAVEETNISRDEAVYLTSKMMVGMGKLISEEKFTLDTLQDRVCVPGGITGAGISSLERDAQDMFHHLFQTTHEKFDEDIQQVKQSFKDSGSPPLR